MYPKRIYCTRSLSHFHGGLTLATLNILASFGVLSTRAILIVSCTFTLLLNSLINAESSSERVVEEIVVTATKQEESLQDVDQAVTALTTQDLGHRNINTFLDLNGVAPGLSVSSNEGSRLVMTIRGVGNEANQNAIANPSVSYHLDGIYIASPTIAHASLVDLHQIEVLRGPQGSLFGQNASGGVVSVRTQVPDSKSNHGSMSLEVGNYNRKSISAKYNTAISEQFAIRWSGTALDHSGYARNISLNQSLDDESSYSVRSRLLWKPQERLSFDLALQASSNNRNGPAQKGIFDATVTPRNVAQDYPSLWELDAQIASLVVTHEAETFTFKSLSSYQTDSLYIHRDNDRHDLSSIPPFTILPAAYEPWQVSQDTMTQELQVVLPFRNQPFNWHFGFFYLSTDVDINIREYIDFGSDGVFDPVSIEDVKMFALGDYGFISNSNPKRIGHSWFFQSTFDLSHKSRVVTGARVTQDSVESHVTNFYGRSGTDILSIDSDSTSARFSFEHDLAPSAMSYISMVRGFKPGGSNLTFGREDSIAAIVVPPTFKHETVTMIEAGLKTSFWHQRLRLNAALYEYRYRDMQYQATDPEVFQGGVNNIPDSLIRGFEAEFSGQVSRNLRLELNLATLRTEVTSDHFTLDNVASDMRTNELLAQGLPLFGPEIQRARADEIRNVKGNQLPKTPNTTVNLHIRYEWFTASNSNLTTALTLTHRGDMQYRIFNNHQRDVIPRYTTANFNLHYQPLAKNWSLVLRVLNMTDELGINSRFTDVFGVGATSESYIPPRLVQLGWRTHF